MSLHPVSITLQGTPTAVAPVRTDLFTNAIPIIAII